MEAHIEFRPYFHLHLCLFLLLLGIVIYSYHQARPNLSLKTKAILIGLRGMALFSFLLILWDPRFIYQTQLIEKQPLVLLVDASKSMALPYSSKGSRAEVSQEFLSKSQASLDKLAEHFDFLRSGFHQEFVEKETPHGSYTDIYGALSRLGMRYPGKSVVVLLLSDGAHNFSKSKNFPAIKVFTWRVCPFDSESPDVQAYRFLLPSRFYVEQPFQGKLMVTANQKEFASLRIKVEFGSQTKEIEGKYQGEFAMFPFEFTPKEEGSFTLKAEVEAVPNEKYLANNKIEKNIKVQKEGISILYLENRFRLEQKWLLRTLAQMPSLQVDFQLVSKEKKWPVKKKLKHYKALILGDINFEIPKLTEYVENGGGLWLLGREKSSIEKSEVWKKLSPCEVHELEWIQKKSTFLVEKQSLFPQLAKYKNTSFLPLERYLKMGPPKAGAHKILSLSPKKEPLLVLNQVGLGRVALLNTDTFYRLIYNNLPENSYQNGKLFYQIILRQVLLWLANQKEDVEVQVELEKKRFAQGEPIVVQLHTSLKASFKGSLTYRSFKETQSFEKKEDSFQATWAPTIPGEYLLKLSGDLAGKKFYAREIIITVYEKDLEKQTRANPQLLQELSEQTGGISVPIEEGEQVFEALEKNFEPVKVLKQNEKRLWDSSFLFLIFFICLVLEWIQRKKIRLL